jgi:hypothetical protein
MTFTTTAAMQTSPNTGINESRGKREREHGCCDPEQDVPDGAHRPSSSAFSSRLLRMAMQRIQPGETKNTMSSTLVVLAERPLPARVTVDDPAVFAPVLVGALRRRRKLEKISTFSTRTPSAAVAHSCDPSFVALC